ncbi:MAG: hypothetical protein KBT06_01195 [Prevotellaceae bacterium]|nr:hypothetical protein [Candidatus Colivivens equi]
MGFIQKYPYTDFHELNLDWVLAKFKEFEDRLDNVQLTILDQIKEYTDGRIAEIQTQVDGLKTDIDSFERQVEAQLATVDARYDTFVGEVRAQLQLLRAEVDHFDEVIRSDIAQVNERTDAAIAQNNEYLLEEIGKGIINVKVLNYFTGEYVTIQQMFDYLANFHLENAITVNQLISRDKTYIELIAYDMSYTELAVNGGTIIQ